MKTFSKTSRISTLQDGKRKRIYTVAHLEKEILCLVEQHNDYTLSEIQSIVVQDATTFPDVFSVSHTTIHRIFHCNNVTMQSLYRIPEARNTESTMKKWYDYGRWLVRQQAEGGTICGSWMSVASICIAQGEEEGTLRDEHPLFACQRSMVAICQSMP